MPVRSRTIVRIDAPCCYYDVVRNKTSGPGPPAGKSSTADPIDPLQHQQQCQKPWQGAEIGTSHLEVENRIIDPTIVRVLGRHNADIGALVLEGVIDTQLSRRSDLRWLVERGDGVEI